MIHIVGVKKSDELIKFERFEDKLHEAIIVIVDAAREYTEMLLEKAIGIVEFVKESTKERDRLPKIDFTRVRMVDQVTIRKPRNIIRKII